MRSYVDKNTALIIFKAHILSRMEYGSLFCIGSLLFLVRDRGMKDMVVTIPEVRNRLICFVLSLGLNYLEKVYHTKVRLGGQNSRMIKNMVCLDNFKVGVKEYFWKMFLEDQVV